MNTRHIATLLAVACLFLTGCLVESKNPLSSPAASLYAPHLEGEYRQTDKEETSFWLIRHRRENRGKDQDPGISPWIDVATVGYSKNGSLERSGYKMLATQIAGRKYLSFISLPADGSKERKVSYSFARYEVTRSGELRIWLAAEAPFVAAVKAGKLRGRVIPHRSGKIADSVELTDTTARIAAFIAAGDPGTLFGGKPMVLYRIAPAP